MPKKKASKKVKRATKKIECEACKATGLKDRNTLCPKCDGHGYIEK